MNRIPLFITVLILAAIAALLWWSRQPEPEPVPDTRVGSPLLAAAAAEAATRITLSADDNSATLVRTEAGTWVVEDRFGLPADFGKLRRLVGELAEAKVVRFVTAATDRLERLELGRATVSLYDASGTPLAELRFGRAANGGGSFVAFTSDGPAYETAANPWIDAGAAGWLQKQVLDFSAEDAARVEFLFAGAHPPLVAERPAPGAPWTTTTEAAEGSTFRPEEVERVLGQYLTARYSEARALEESDASGARAAAEPLLRVSLFDGRSYGLTIGRRPAPPAEPTTAEPGAEDAPAPPPAPQPGPVFLFYDLPEADSVWAEALQQAALEYYEYLYSSRPVDPASFFTSPGDATEAPDAAAASAPPPRSGPISVVTEPIAVPPWPAPAADPEPAP